MNRATSHHAPRYHRERRVPVRSCAPTSATPTGYQAALPADYDDKVKAVADREAELKRAFRAGELEFDEFETRRDELQRCFELMRDIPVVGTVLNGSRRERSAEYAYGY